MMSLKKYNNFVSEELNDFYKDLENGSRKLRLFSTFNKSILGEFKTNFMLPQPKKRFQPKVKSYKKINNDKGIF
jgi:hypothetical protein